MRGFKMMALAALAVPALATAQVGPNPAASSGAGDPPAGSSSDPTLAPHGSAAGTSASLPDRPSSTTTDPVTGDAAGSTDAGTSGTTTGGTKGMKRGMGTGAPPPPPQR